jgi:hypothetical protein
MHQPRQNLPARRIQYFRCLILIWTVIVGLLTSSPRYQMPIGGQSRNSIVRPMAQVRERMPYTDRAAGSSNHTAPRGGQ